MAWYRDFFAKIIRRKPLGSDEELYETPLRRSLNTTQLAVMGMSAMIGSGLYVLTGVEAKEVVGPAIIISYAIAAVASILSALCYVEFACRIPRTGSAYTFAYISLGELWAFVIGWDLVLEYAITAAAIATSVVGYLDSLTGYAIGNFTVETVMGGHSWHVPYLAPYPNLLVPLVVILVTLFIVCGANVSSWVTTVCMAINLSVIFIIVVVGFSKADITNWEDYGGFVPNGTSSVIAAAATLFFSYVGFDAIAMANEETVNPRKSIPTATFVAILITSVCYILASAVLTLMVPYTDLDEQSAFTSAFQVNGIEWARWMVGMGAICAMFSALTMNLYCIPRTLYAMASDGLLFNCLSVVNSYTRVPVYASLLAMVLVTLPATFIPLAELVEFISIGVLLGYAFVAGAVIFLRYGPEDLTAESDQGLGMASLGPTTDAHNHPPFDDNSTLLDTTSVITPGTLRHRFRSTPLLNKLGCFEPGWVVKIALFCSVVFMFCTVALFENASSEIASGEWWSITLLILLSFCSIGTFLVIPLHYQNEDTKQYYRVPFVPIFPWLSILCNIVLLLKLRGVTWLRYLVWLIVGLTIYTAYGYRHSKVGRRLQLRSESTDINFRGNEQDGNDATYGSMNRENQ